MGKYPAGVLSINLERCTSTTLVGNGYTLSTILFKCVRYGIMHKDTKTTVFMVSD